MTALRRAAAGCRGDAIGNKEWGFSRPPPYHPTVTPKLLPVNGVYCRAEAERKVRREPQEAGGGAEMEKEGTGAERVGGHDGGIMGPPPACCYVISEAAFAARM